MGAPRHILYYSAIAAGVSMAWTAHLRVTTRSAQNDRNGMVPASITNSIRPSGHRARRLRSKLATS